MIDRVKVGTHGWPLHWINVVSHFISIHKACPMRTAIVIRKDWLFCLELLEMWSDNDVQNLILIPCTIEVAVDCSQWGHAFIGHHPPANHYRSSKCLWPWLNIVLIVIFTTSWSDTDAPINMVETELRLITPPDAVPNSFVSLAMLLGPLHTFPFVPGIQWSLFSKPSAASPCGR